MSWRFRKSFKVLPGVRLNLTSRGLSATVGVAPLSVNFGPRGVYANTSIPGTGIWNRQRLDVPSTTENSSGTLPPDESEISKRSEIHSASTEQLTSEDLEPLRTLLREAHQERTELLGTIRIAALYKQRWSGCEVSLLNAQTVQAFDS
jgi:hypothetical protein